MNQMAVSLVAKGRGLGNGTSPQPQGPWRCLVGARQGGHTIAGGRINADWEDARAPVQSATSTYQMAEFDPADLDVVELHDATVFAEIHLIEDLGLCPRGSGGPFTASGASGRDEKLSQSTPRAGSSRAAIQSGRQALCSTKLPCSCAARPGTSRSQKHASAWQRMAGDDRALTTLSAQRRSLSASGESCVEDLHAMLTDDQRFTGLTRRDAW